MPNRLQKIVMGSDHAGLNLKNHLVNWLQEQQLEVTDKGVFSPESMDYPDIAAEVAQAVASGAFQAGIIVCGSGIGVSMAANKVAGVRAALCHDPVSARLARQHNDANVLTMGERIITPMMAEEVVKAWLEADFEAGRHQRRVDKMTQLDQKRENDNA